MKKDNQLESGTSRGSTKGKAAAIQQAELRAKRAEARVRRAALRTKRAEERTKRAEARAQLAETRTEEAKTRVEEAETRTERAESRTELAETRTEHAESRTEMAKTRAEQAETRLERVKSEIENTEVVDQDVDPTDVVARHRTLAPSSRLVPQQGGLDSSNALVILTTRQRDILQMIAEGQTTKQIASVLSLSPKTVEYHRMKLMKGLNIHDIPGLVRFALRVGLVPPHP